MVCSLFEVTALGCASVHDRLVLESADGSTRRYSIESEERDCAHEVGTDFAAIAAGAVSITPLRFELVDVRAFDLLEGWDLSSAVTRVLLAARDDAEGDALRRGVG